MGSDDEHRRRSRKYDGSGKSKHHEGDRRHRYENRHRRKDRDERKPWDKDENHGDGGCRKLTEEEERLYAKARKYVEREEKANRHRKLDRHDHRKASKRRHSESFDSSDCDVSSKRRDSKKSLRKDQKCSRRDKDHDKKSSRHKKKSKHSHRNRDDERPDNRKKKHSSKPEGSFRDKSSSIDKSKLVNIGDILHDFPDRLDLEKNYFSHNSHLRLYLYRTYGIYFEDLSSSESRQAFKEFSTLYNAGKLERAYYDTSGLLPQEALDQYSRTKHQWKFRTNKTEEQSLEIVRAGVKKQTEYNNTVGGTVKNNVTVSAPSGKKSMVPFRPPNGFQADDHARQRKTPQELVAQRKMDKQYRDQVALGNEEMFGVGGKADHGWEHKLHKKREQSNRLHGAAQDKEGDAYGGPELDDHTLYGPSVVGPRRERGEGVTFKEDVAKERQYRERREAEKATRASDLLEKEEEKQKKMFEVLGLSGIKAGQKITITPREDG